MDEARLDDSGSGLTPVTEGWFVVNVRDAEWWYAEYSKARLKARRQTRPGGDHQQLHRTASHSIAAAREVQASGAYATKKLRDESDELEFVGPQCNLRDIDRGIAVGSAAKTAAIHSIDSRCQTRIAVAARKLGLIKADIAVALSLSLTHKAVGFDRHMPEIDFDALDLSATGTLPLGVPGAGREGGARNRQQPRRPSRTTARTKRPEA